MFEFSYTLLTPDDVIITRKWFLATLILILFIGRLNFTVLHVNGRLEDDIYQIVDKLLFWWRAIERNAINPSEQTTITTNSL
jgi:hypothetical protein